MTQNNTIFLNLAHYTKALSFFLPSSSCLDCTSIQNCATFCATFVALVAHVLNVPNFVAHWSNLTKNPIRGPSPF